MKKRIARDVEAKYKTYKQYRDWHGRIAYEIYLKQEEESYKKYQKDIDEAFAEDNSWMFDDVLNKD